MSGPRGNREFRGSSRSRGHAYTPRGKPTLLHRGLISGNSEDGGRMLMYEESGSGSSIGINAQHMAPQYGAPPKSAFDNSSYGSQQPSFSRLAFQSAPSVQGPTSAFAPEIQKQMMPQGMSSFPLDSPSLDSQQDHNFLYQPLQTSPYAVLHAPPLTNATEGNLLPMQQQDAYPQFLNATVNQLPIPQSLAMQYARGLSSTTPSSLLQMQHRAQQQYYHIREQQIRNEPKFYVEPLPKISPTLKKIICFTANKKLAALVETDDDEQIRIARSDLEEDFRNYDGRSNVPISQCSMPFLKKRKIEYLVVPHPQFPWAPYYCTLCDFHISDLFAADAHLSTHMKEEKRLDERRTLPERLPPLTNAQLSAIEKVLVEAAVTECPPDRESKLRATASDAMESLKRLCNNTKLNSETLRIHVSLHGSLVSGILTRTSDINISLRVDGENTKYFVDGLFTTMEQESEWSEVKVSESPTGHARLQALFSEEKITIDWQNEEGVKLSQLLSLYNRLHEDVLPLRQIVRQWAQKCDLTTPEKLSSQHAVPPVLLDVMLIHALQQSRRIPCIHELPNFAGKDLFNLEEETIFDDINTMNILPNSSIHWNLAELFLEFLLYFSKGDAKQFLIQITSTQRALKTDTKFNKRHLNVFDPIKDRPIASLHKAFQCYFINCFLTTYIHFRIPRIRDNNGVGSKPIVNVDVYQTAIQSPLKKKTNKGGQKDEGEHNEKPVPLNQPPFAIDHKEHDEIDSSELYSRRETAAVPSNTPSIIKATNNEGRVISGPSFLTSLLDCTIRDSIADRTVFSPRFTLILATNSLMEEEDAAIDAIMLKTHADFIIGLRVANSVHAMTRTSRSTIAHTIRVGIPNAHMSSVISMREAVFEPPFAWKVIGESPVVVVDLAIRNEELPVKMRFIIGTDKNSNSVHILNNMLSETERAIALGMWKDSDLVSDVDKWSINEEMCTIGKGVKIEEVVYTDDGVVMTISIGKPIMIHGIALEEMLPEHFEIDADNVYSRRSMMCIKESRENRLNKEIWVKLSDEGLNTLYLAPDSDEEALSAPPTNSLCSASSMSKRKSKRNVMDGDNERKDELENVKQKATSLQIAPQGLSIGECTAVAMGATVDNDAKCNNEAYTYSSLRSIPAPIAVTKVAKRALKLIKMDSAESSELSCDPSPTEEDIALEKIGDLTLGLPELTTQSVRYQRVEDSGSAVISVNAVVNSNMLNENERIQYDGNEEIVLPESTITGLQPTFEELYIDLKEFDLNEVTISLAKLCENDYDYSFDSVSLTAGFKCDQHCSACDSPKHLVTECPQLKVPPILNISRSHWKQHYSGELDRIICMIFNNEKISNARHKELTFVKTRLQDAIRKKLKNDFRLDAFGSSENGFGSNESDYDVCFRYGNDNYERSSEMQIQTIINIENALRSAKFSRVMSITTAKVPIVKFAIRVESGEIEGDISYYNELALHNTQLLKRYCSWTKDETLSKLGMFIKKWAKHCEIGDASKGSLSSYAYIILLIHFLQRLLPHPLLPVLQEMGEKRNIQVDGWDVYFCDDEPRPSWSQCTLSISELFLQFLEYFAKFDWQNQVVQIRQSNKLTKIEKGWRKLMCIEDPFDLDHNLGSGISPRMFAFIMKSFVISREVFFTLKERDSFVRSNMPAADKAVHDIVVADSHICRYGHSLFARCRTSIGCAPRDRQCFKCGRIGHYSDACPVAHSGFARRGGGRGGGAMSRDERGGMKRDDNRYRDARKERLMAQRESYRVANEK